MKPRHKQQHTLQNKKFIWVALSVFVCLMGLYIYFAPEKGIFRQRRLENRIASLELKNKALSQKQDWLGKEIERLKKDDEYIEEIARKKYGLLRNNEIIFELKSEG